MRAWLERHRGEIVGILSLLVTALVLANVLKERSLSLAWLKQNKDAITAATGIATTLLVFLGGIFSYYRFFRGRTFSSRAELKLSIAVHPTTEDFNLHSIVAEIKNLGSMPIWDPKPTIWLTIHGPEGNTKRVIDDWFDPPSSSAQDSNITVVESTETTSFFAQQKIPKVAWVVTYLMAIRSRSGDVWHVGSSVSNTIVDKCT
jgi:hypothetical protein